MEPAPPTGEGRRFERHAFVCLSDSSCAHDGPAQEIRAWMKAQTVARGIKETLRINKAGCLGQCGHGPMMVVYPEGVWYSHLDLEDAKQIFEEHLIGGTPVESLRYRTPPAGTNLKPRGADMPGATRCTRCPG